MDFPTNREIEEAINNIAVDIFSYNNEIDLLKDISALIQDRLYHLKFNYSVINIEKALYKWINFGSNLVNMLSKWYPLNDNIKHLEYYRAYDLPCILNNISILSDAAKGWLYSKGNLAYDWLIIDDALKSGALKFYYDGMHLEKNRVVKRDDLIEWVQKRIDISSDFMMKVPLCIEDQEKKLNLFLNKEMEIEHLKQELVRKDKHIQQLEDKNTTWSSELITDYMEFIHHLRLKFIDDIKKGITAEKLLDLIKQEKSDTELNNKCTFYVFKYSKNKEIKITDNLLKSFITIIRGSDLSFRK